MRILALAVAIAMIPQGEEVTLRLKPKRNAIFKYTTVNTVTTASTGSAGTPLQSMVKVALRVLESNGKSIKIQSTVEDIKSDSVSAREGKGAKITYVMSPLAQLVETVLPKEAGVSVDSVLKNSLKFAPAFPESPVKVGSKWNVDVNLSEIFASMSSGPMAIKGDAKATLVLTLEKIEAVDRKRLVTIRSEMAKEIVLVSGNQDMPLSWKLEGFTTFDLTSGMSTKQDVKQVQILQMPGEKALTITIATIVTLDEAS